MKVMYLRPVHGGGAGGYLVSFDPEASDGHGSVVLSRDLKCAKRFPNAREPYLLWRTVPHRRQLRADGQPNRPLTAYHLEVMDEGQEPLP